MELVNQPNCSDNEDYSINRYLQIDLVTARKIEEDHSYYDRLLVVDSYITSLDIKSDLQFYVYSQVIDKLEGIPYSDTQAFQRFKNEEYYKYVCSYLPPDIKVIK